MFDESVTEHFDDWADESIIETTDSSDETKLRRLVEFVEEVLGMPGAVNLHVMGHEQWEQAQTALMARRHRNGAELHLQVIRDPHRPNQLFASPSMVAGINEVPPSGKMLNQMVSAVIAASGPRLTSLFSRGSANLFSEHICSSGGYDFFTGMWRREGRFLRRLIAVLVDYYGFEELDWLRELKSRPGKFHLALRSTEFWRHAIEKAKDDEELVAKLATSPNRAKDLSAILNDSRTTVDSHVARFLDDLIDPFLKKSSSKKGRS